MENILKKKEKELIEEGLGYIDSWEEFTKKNEYDLYEKYSYLKTRKLSHRENEWNKLNRLLDDTKEIYIIRGVNDNFLVNFEDTFKEIEKYIDTFKPKVFFFFFNRENLNSIVDLVIIINELSILHDTSKLNCTKNSLFFF